jgi:hypothetical protein
VVIRDRVPPVVVLLGRAILVVLAVVPLVLLLTRSVPPAPSGTAAPPAGLGGIGTGVVDPPSPSPVDVTVPDGLPPASPAGAAPAPAGGGGAVAAPAAAPAPPATGPAPAPAPKPLPLKASYATVHSGLTGYDGRVTVTNPNAAPGTGWKVVLQLPVGELVTAASDGAGYAQSLTTVTLTGPPVPGHGTYACTVTVTGAGPVAKPPTSCTVDGNPCGSAE